VGGLLIREDGGCGAAPVYKCSREGGRGQKTGKASCRPAHCKVVHAGRMAGEVVGFVGLLVGGMGVGGAAHLQIRAGREGWGAKNPKQARRLGFGLY